MAGREAGRTARCAPGGRALPRLAYSVRGDRGVPSLFVRPLRQLQDERF
jgi:hypothetical protein